MKLINLQLADSKKQQCHKMPLTKSNFMIRHRKSMNQKFHKAQTQSIYQKSPPKSNINLDNQMKYNLEYFLQQYRKTQSPLHKNKDQHRLLKVERVITSPERKQSYEKFVQLSFLDQIKKLSQSSEKAAEKTTKVKKAKTQIIDLHKNIKTEPLVLIDQYSKVKTSNSTPKSVIFLSNMYENDSKINTSVCISKRFKLNNTFGCHRRSTLKMPIKQISSYQNKREFKYSPGKSKDFFIQNQQY